MLHFTKIKGSNNAMTVLKKVFKLFFKRDILAFFFLGLSCGIPLNLIGNTLAVRATQSGLDLKTIGLFALVMTPYSLKFLWSPVIDTFSLPFANRFGKKKTWAVLFQICLGACLLSISLVDVAMQTNLLFALCFLCAFCSASQDIVVDALRIDVLDEDSLKEASSTYQLGYRIAMLITGAGVIALSSRVSWATCYQLSVVLFILGICGLFLIKEPVLKQKTSSALPLKQMLIEPFSNFISRHKNWFILLCFILLYKMCNAFLGKMAYPFYLKTGFSPDEIALVSGTIGTFITMFGVFCGGALMLKFGYLKSLMYLGFVEILTSVAFALLAVIGPKVYAFMGVIIFDNIVGGMGGAVWVGFLSSLCVPAYSATQYALLTSFTMFSTSVLAAYSGHLAEYMGWEKFFLSTGFMMIPALILLGWMLKKGE